MKKQAIYEALIHAPFAYALHEMLFDGDGKARDFTWIEVNPMFERYFKKENMTGMTYTEAFKDDPLEYDWVSFFADVLKKGETVIKEKYIRQTGKWIMVYAYPVDERQFVSFLFNITERKNLDKREKQLKDALDMLDTHIYMKDRDSNYYYGNKPTQALFGVGNEFLDYKSDFDFFSNETARMLRDLDLRILSGEKTREEIKTVDNRGNTKYYLEIKAPILESDESEPAGIIGMSTDITEKKMMEDEIKHLIDHDRLTNAYTRHKVFDALEETLKETDDLAVAILDIDRFKDVNDAYGHLVGDTVLKAFVTRLKKTLDETAMIGRFGGEEFIVLFTEKTKERAKEILDEVLDSLKKDPVKTNGSTIELSFSGGIATPYELEAPLKIEDLLGLADKRLYHAKNSGRKQIHTD